MCAFSGDYRITFNKIMKIILSNFNSLIFLNNLKVLIKNDIFKIFK